MRLVPLKELAPKGFPSVESAALQENRVLTRNQPRQLTPSLQNHEKSIPVVPEPPAYGEGYSSPKWSREPLKSRLFYLALVYVLPLYLPMGKKLESTQNPLHEIYPYFICPFLFFFFFICPFLSLSP